MTIKDIILKDWRLDDMYESIHAEIQDNGSMFLFNTSRYGAEPKGNLIVLSAEEVLKLVQGLTGNDAATVNCEGIQK